MNNQKITIKHEGNDWVMRVDGAEYFRFGTKAAVEHAAYIYRRTARLIRAGNRSQT